MQVSQITSVDSHAVIGGGETRAFRMTDSAEFFTVLSSTLYRDKKRAVVREVICNAWDAHITTGKTDIPVEITLSENELTIKDFGPGIHDDLIADIYCIYGGSTKTHDGKQTGGFGLGSKAPFAYTDHFTVTSCHNGVKSVYAVSRGGVETDGRPGIRPMVCIPTTETGLTVSIPIRDQAEDVLKFDATIRSVVSQGGINTKLNGNQLRTTDYTEMKKLGFMISDRSDLIESRIYVLYGSVLYPLTTSEREMTKPVDDLRARIGNKVLILHAPANSIGITPSRESISYTEPTKKMLADLMKRAERLLCQNAQLAVRMFFDAKLKEHGIEALSMPITGCESAVTGRDYLTRMAARCAEFILTREEIARIAGKSAAKFFPRFRKKLVRRRNNFNYDHNGKWGHIRTVEEIRIRPFMKIAIKAGLVKSVYAPQMNYNFNERGGDGFSSYEKVRRFNTIDRLHSEIVVARTFANAARKIKELKRTTLDRYKLLVFTIVNKKLTDEKIAEIQALAARYKLTSVYAEPEPRAAPTPRIKRTDYFTPHHVDRNEDGTVKLNIYPRATTASKVSNPDFFIPVESGRRTKLPFRSVSAIFVARKFKIDGANAKIAIATSAAEITALRKSGARPFLEAIADDVEGMLKDKSLLFQRLKESHFFPSCPSLGVTESAKFAIRMAQEDHRFAEVLFGIKLKSSPRLEQFIDYTKALEEFTDPLVSISADPDRITMDRERLNKILYVSQDTGKKVFEKSLAKVSVGDFDYLADFVGSLNMKLFDAKLSHKSFRDQMLTVIRALKRDSIVNSKNNSTLKEAA